MRTKRGCQSCRSRHIKCVTEAGSSVCARCKESQRSCLFDSKFRFKSVDHVDTASQGVRSRTRLVYDDDQFWVPTKQALGFILEDGAGAEYGTADFIERDECSDEAVEICEPRQPDTGLPSPPVAQIASSGSQEIGIDDQTNLVDNGSSSENIIVPTLSGKTSPETAWQPHIIGEQELAQQQHEANGNSSGAVRNSVPIAAIVEDYTSPASLSELSRRHDSGRRLTWGTGEYGFLIGDSSPAMEVIQTPASATAIDLSHREALLMQHFIQKLAPWIDCCDHICHFAQEVPRRAVRVPMVLYAILALSSRHQSSITGCDELEASYYHGQCVELVIDALSKAESSYDDNLFATIVCLRIYEELDETVDAFLHLQGVGRLLHAIPNFAHAGGLAEAASWQALRQDVYVAIHNKSQPTLDLENYGRSRVFDFRDEDACANVVILLFARMLRLLHSPSGASDYGAWDEIEQHIELWDAQRSLLFQPLFVQEASASEGQPFPVLRLINPAQVVALQYYNACLVLLRQHKPPDLSLAGFEAVKERRNVERNLVIALGNVVGLAESNAWVQNANFTAHHMLRSSGYHINDPKQREHSINFLHRIQQVMGFKTQSTIALLLDQWRDLD